MIWALDIDGVITANPAFFSWFTYHLCKKGNNNQVFIISSRNPSRRFETEMELETWNITYDKLFSMDKRMKRDYKTQAEWKKSVVKRVKADIWIDNEFKVYERCCGVSFDDIKAERIQI